MRWQVEVTPHPHLTDSLGRVVARKLQTLGLEPPEALRTARLFFIEGDLDRDAAVRLAGELLADPVVERAEVHSFETYEGKAPGTVTVFKKPGVMDPVEAGVLRGAKALGLPLVRALTATRFALPGCSDEQLRSIAERCLANPAIEDVQVGNDRFPVREAPKASTARRREVPLRNATPAELIDLSRNGGLSLSLVEMQSVQDHFRKLLREPTDIELETVAQTWSEHCKHKTLAGSVRYRGPATPDEGWGPPLEDGQELANVLKQTVFEATRRLNRDFCLSVFHDNAGVIAFEGDQALCFKVETHNHPSAIEPYGGAGTGIGGVIRDILGTGLGARPVANTNVFCVGPLDLAAHEVPKGAMHPLRILRGVVEGVRDYGNQMGIPTVNGAVVFDRRYVGNPLVFCGTVGLIPKHCVDKQVRPKDLIVAVGGRTGRDGIHGATFSSLELHEESDTIDSGAVQIGNAITEKKVAEVVLLARDRGLFSAITDCGAGGFSSAVGEMSDPQGARVHLDRAPLKYAGLSPTEVWISEAQERMVLAVPPEKAEELLELCASEDVEAFVLGEFTSTHLLELFFGDVKVGELDTEFLHRGLPRVTREGTWKAPQKTTETLPACADPKKELLRLLAHPNVASKEWIVRQYDHEVQAGSVIKPLVGTRGHGPSDGAVLAPLLGQRVGFALGLGLNPSYGDVDPYAMARAAVDEALRNVVSVGGDPEHCAILDNFCWGNTQKPDRLGGLVRAAFGCRDAALALGTPFISGKDSLNNEFRVGEESIVIPPTLLVSAIARVPDVRFTVTMDLKSPENLVYLVGSTALELGGSLWLSLHGLLGQEAPRFHGERARRIFGAVHEIIAKGLVRSCHDLSEGGLAVAAAEMVLAGDVGMEIDVDLIPRDDPSLDPLAALFSESLSRFLLEIECDHAPAVEESLSGVPWARVGVTSRLPTLRIRSGERTLIEAGALELEAAFRPPLGRHLDGETMEVSHG